MNNLSFNRTQPYFWFFNATKNITIPGKHEYLIQLSHSLDLSVKRLGWKVHHFLNPNPNQKNNPEKPLDSRSNTTVSVIRFLAIHIYSVSRVNCLNDFFLPHIFPMKTNKLAILNACL